MDIDENLKKLFHDSCQLCINSYFPMTRKDARSFAWKKCRQDFMDYKLIERINIGQFQGFVFSRGKDFGIVETGTNQFSDWIKNLKAWKKDIHTDKVFGEGTAVASGDYDIFMQAHKIIKKYIINAASKKQGNIYIFGHSLGGGLGQITLLHMLDWLKDFNFDRVTAVFPGSKRTCNKKAQELLDKNYKNIYILKNENDPVVNVPTEYMGYHLPGKHYKLGKEFPLYYPPLLRLIPLWDHRLNEYIDNIKLGIIQNGTI